jgi:hypothetical protein
LSRNGEVRKGFAVFFQAALRPLVTEDNGNSRPMLATDLLSIAAS